jgi:hypothetical protein
MSMSANNVVDIGAQRILHCAKVRQQDADKQMVDELRYRNYRFNRDTSDISAERWASLFGPNAAAFEERYQQELDEIGCGGCGRVVCRCDRRQGVEAPVMGAEPEGD